MARKKRAVSVYYREETNSKIISSPLFKKISSVKEKLYIVLLLAVVFFIKVGQVPLSILKIFLLFILDLYKKVVLNNAKSSTKLKISLPNINLRISTVVKDVQSKTVKAKPKSIKKSTPIITKLRVGIAFFLFFITAYTILIIKISEQLPSPDRLTTVQRPLTTQIYDQKGNLLYQIYEGQNRKLIQLNQLPKHLIDATIAIEDKHFYSHPGIDFWGILRALKTNLEEDSLQGGSTITQQLIKNTLLTPDKTITRKIKEVVLSIWAEAIYSKEEILTMYFNEVPYGGPAWGVEAASEMYFGKSAKDLTLAESAYLAGLPAAPTEYSPYGTNPEKGKQRQKEVLRRMVEDGYITQYQADQAYNEPLTFRPPTIDIKAPHFVMYVRSLLANKYGQRLVSQGGLQVTTTLDLDIQRMAEKVVSEQVQQLANLQVSNGAAMVIDAQNGHILAMVGSKDYFDPDGGNYNVTLALRQPGSSIKPVTYTAAFKEGYTPGTILLDTPTIFPNPWGKPYAPVNYDGRFHGPVTIRTALGSSYNVPAVKMLAVIGIEAMIQTAKEMGITTFTNSKDYGLSITLGGGAVRMIDMMSVYTTLASGGIKYQPTAILKVTDSYGNVLEDNTKASGERVLSEEIAYLISDILSDNNARTPAFGPNSLLKIANKTVAVKTGTSDDKRDNWAFGYTPKYVVGAWVGNNDYSPMHPRLSSGITGATPIWHHIMSGLIGNSPDIAFKRPSNIIEVTTSDGKKDLAIAGIEPKKVVSSKVVKQKDQESGEEKEVITYTDPFTFNFIPNLPQQQPN